MNIGFISTRLAGTDGVSLETAKLATVLRRMGHQVFYCAGELEDGGPSGMLVREMHFRNPENEWISAYAFGTMVPHPELRPRLEHLKATIKAGLKTFLSDCAIDLLIPENALAIPMQLPLGLAIAETIAETDLPTIAHHHDFYWERERFRVHCVGDVLDRAFPPNLPTLRHIVINSIAQRELEQRRGVDSTVVPNVFDFATPAPGLDDYNADLRVDIGLGDDDLLILQPTRVVPRKGIELAIELLQRLGEVRGKHPGLIITHHAGDEGLDYLHRLQSLAQEAGVDLRYVADRFDTVRRPGPDGQKVYVLWDAYVHADFVTYPSLIEGFGNALIETVYFKKPALVNRYPVYVTDIGPLGFDFVEIDGRITDAAVAQVRELLADPAHCEQMVEHNYRLGWEHFSFERLEKLLRGLLEEVESS
jgi:glycosyltransferase involved in cell wall biosynthesis